MSAEKVAVLRALGAEIIRTPTQAAFDSPESHIGVARRLQKEIPNAHILDQYGNSANPDAHQYGTAEEIWQQTEGKVSCVVAGAGTGGTITGLARGLKKHSKDVKIVAADPHGSILALPRNLNEEHANESYKVEGIGYDFIPDVLDQESVDTWYKTDDRESFMYARRLISEEGILVGGSSGSAMAAMVRAVKDLGLGKDDTVCVVLPDSIRSYLSKFADDDWLAANDLLPPSPPLTPPLQPEHQQTASSTDEAGSRKVEARESSAVPFRVRTNSLALKPTVSEKDPLHGATIRTLRLKPITTVTSETPCIDATELMRERGFDQLPVKSSPSESSRLVGLITLGNILSYLASGRAKHDTPVKEAMFDFSRMHEIKRDPRDLTFADSYGSRSAGRASNRARDDFVEITMDTPLSALSRFFEWNSAAIVTERVTDAHTLRPVAVVTKVDLLNWLVRQSKQAGEEKQ